MSESDSKKTKKTVLGKGLNSLLGLNSDMNDTPTKKEVVPSSPANDGRVSVLEVRPEAIEPNPNQPRKHFVQAEIEELATSLKVDGVLQPLIVTTKQDEPGRFLLIAGERRWRASQLAGLQKVPVIIKDISPNDRLRVALIENIQRADLNVIEEALAYRSLIEEIGLTQEGLAQKIGKDRATIANTMRLLSLPDEVQQDIVNKKLTMGHGRALLSIGDNPKILMAREIVLKKDLSVRQTEQLCKKIKKEGLEEKKPENPVAPSTANADLAYLMEHLRSHLRTKVKFIGSASRGKIEISYFSAVELERILNTIGYKE